MRGLDEVDEQHQDATAGRRCSGTGRGPGPHARALSTVRTARKMLGRTLELSMRANADSPEEKSDQLKAIIKLDCLSVCRTAW